MSRESRLSFASRFTGNRFLKQVAIIMAGTGIAQILTVVAAPLLSRLYEPSSFGLFALYTSIVSVLAGIMTLRYELAIVLPKTNEEAGSLFILSLLIVLGMSGAVFLILWGISVTELLPLSTTDMTQWLWWIPLSVLAMGVYQTLSYWCTRRQAFMRISTSQVLRSTGVTATQITGGVLNAGASGLIGGQILGQVLISTYMGAQVWKEDKNLFKTSCNWARIKQLAKSYVRFPLYNTPQNLLNAISQNIPAILLMKAYGAAVVGWYALAVRLIEMPLSLMGKSLSQVYFQRISQAYHQGVNLYVHLRKTTLILAVMGLFPAATIIVLGPAIFALVLGEEWREAGVYARWIVVWLFFGFLNSPAVATAQVYAMQRFLLGYEVLLFLTRTSALYVGVAYLDAVSSIALYSIIGACFNLALVLSVLTFVRRQLQKDAQSM
ncbi:lipopolysaccharide biosynthesis protein [Brevibacillus sp. 179-C9.3 HS]|uniref:lipopolysaccharide biosynthesis protein n=1 Tax=unclassified Brevibacillus TaxID=2684853 RepID=UPI00399F3183